MTALSTYDLFISILLFYYSNFFKLLTVCFECLDIASHSPFSWGNCAQIQVFEPFSILGLEPGVSDSEIKKAYRRLSILYHPDKNPDPGWVFFFLVYILF